MNHYEVLEVNSAVSQAEIKASYRRLVKRYHPDINPDESAARKMVLINEAYEVLSNVTSRNLYDLFLSGVPVKTDIEKSRPEQRYREEYKARRVKEEREKIIFLVKLKSRFYVYLRHVNLLFFIIGFLFTIDYYFQIDQREETIEEIGTTRFQTGLATKEGTRVTCSRSLFNDYKNLNTELVNVRYSLFFKVPAKIQMVGSENIYPINNSIYVFRNAFSIIILIFSGVVLKHREYTDFRLSCGLVPGFLILFLVLFVISEML
ncbi:MAG: J domain-containing protein [Ekhidna sp.]|nr:J domain-containing protein [Ekhidna sp.]